MFQIHGEFSPAEPAAAGFPQNSPLEFGTNLAGIGGGRTFDGSRVGDRTWIAHRVSFLVTGLGTPDSNGQMVQSLTSRVLALPSACLPERPVHSAERRGIPVTSIPIYNVGCDFATERFSAAFYLFGVYRGNGQFAE